jgi:HD domain.
MVSDLGKYKSHPEKLLKVHTNGVKIKALKRTNSKIAELAALFHDLGKLNNNFQEKLNGNRSVGYSQHSYVSAFAFLNWYVTNIDFANGILEIESKDITKVKIISAIILHHHGNLPNMDRNLSEQAFGEMMLFLDNGISELPISEYLGQQLAFEHTLFDLSYKGWYKSNIPDIDLGKNGKGYEVEHWQQDALNYFQETQFSFASL